MGTYKANRNINEEELEKSEEEQKLESTKKAVDIAGEVALDYYTGGQFSQIKGSLEKVPIVGNQVTKKWDKAVETVSKPIAETPIGDVAKGLDDAGVTDAAKSAKGMLNLSSGNAGGAGNATEIASKASNSSSIGNLNIDTPNSNNFDDSLENATVTGPKQLEDNKENNESKSTLPFSNKNSGSGINLGNFSFNISTSTKIKIIAIFAAAFLFLIIIVTAFGAADDDHNLNLTDKSKMTEKGGSRKCTSSEIESRIIYIGDSRIVGLQGAVGENAEYIAKSSMGYSWLDSEAIPELETKLASKSNAIVILALGVNDLYNIDNYISAYKSLIVKFPDAKFYVLSVNPVDDEKAQNNGYQKLSSEIDSFNSKLKENFSDNYIDSFNGVKEFNTSDGIHYDDDTYKKIHEFVLSSVSSSNGVTCAATGDLLGKLEELANYFITNAGEYNQGASLYVSILDKNVRKDCSGFVSAYMGYVGGTDLGGPGTGIMIDTTGSWAKSAEAAGWKAYTAKEIGDASNLLPGDVLVEHTSGTNGHTEVYVSPTTTFGWGKRQDHYPLDKTIVNTSAGFGDGYHSAYRIIYRYEGATESNNNSNINNPTG